MTAHADQIDQLETQIGQLEKLVKARALESKDYDYVVIDDSDGDGPDDPYAEIAYEGAVGDVDEPADDAAKDSGRHPFERAADRIAVENDILKAKAMTLARARHPDLYRDYRRNKSGGKSYRELVDAEIAKGFSETVAAQRVNYAYPQLARDRIAKARVVWPSL